MEGVPVELLIYLSRILSWTLCHSPVVTSDNSYTNPGIGQYPLLFPEIHKFVKEKVEIRGILLGDKDKIH